MPIFNGDVLARNRRAKELMRKKAINEKKALGCQKCGYNKYGEVLEWHHLDPTNKIADPSNLLRNGSMPAYKKYKEETKKCILLCANCHKEWHIENETLG